MSHLDIELKQLKVATIELWNLVNTQLAKGYESLISMDKEIALEIISIEKRVNAYEIKVDRDCENIFALFNPVAVDLRFVLAVLKINTNLERTGDIAEGIAKFVKHADANFDKKLLEKTRVLEMFQAAQNMMDHVLEAFEKEDTHLARKIFKEDDILDQINRGATSIIADYIRINPDSIEQALYLLSIIRKLERVGDQAKNMAEEIVFYIEAKVLKHISKLDSNI
ncbi:MAG: phosphate signaling complex protein PhoU [Flavobacteriia bacterium]|nr:phosphate signaling complex protein PhoU [Flavobacteriia bacterium]